MEWGRSMDIMVDLFIDNDLDWISFFATLKHAIVLTLTVIEMNFLITSHCVRTDYDVQKC